ncbi:hypothetical protein FHS31_000160 [Sphingomonas vulcanisoli]|uniref:17 kDa surface antigen n=1 Tax=Sphingomonas vulcanisoli TaxID=1658060 RepID=A0ABX0TM38_9SPHN|nr:glycine zipper 2TM domain-containing protein [Sphingomonas vulcanisoli]NIJ06578.1 hypothetical protein [Sphingomonas vulcanisoli]
MRRLTLAVALAAAAPMALAPIAPAIAQSPQAQARWDAAQRDYQIATDRYNAERDRYMASRRYNRGSGPYGGGYGAPPPPPPGAYGDPTYQTDYDASRYYRDGPGYQERVLSSNDQVYRGSDGRYYCKRNDGTTGLIVGGAAGGILGNVIDGGHNRAAGTLIGVAVGALAGKAIDQSNQQVRCR